MERIEIIQFSEKYTTCFKALNYEWIEKYFTVEPSDEHVLTYPVQSIIEKGGFIYFAKSKNKIIGTFALIKVDDSTYEIAKMAVTEKFQNRGIGKQLMDFAIERAKKMNLKKIILYTNTNLATAVDMYIKYGFQVVDKNDFHNNRANIKMEMVF